MKKTLLTFLFSWAIFFLAQAQGFRWQGVANDASGNPVTQAVTLRFSILKNGAAVFVETQNPITPVAGQLSATVGGGTASLGNFSAIDWANGPYFLKVEMKIGSAAAFLEMGSSQILPVPMALWAASSGGGSSGGWTLNNNILSTTKPVQANTNLYVGNLLNVEYNGNNDNYIANFTKNGTGNAYVGFRASATPAADPKRTFFAFRDNRFDIITLDPQAQKSTSIALDNVNSKMFLGANTVNCAGGLEVSGSIQLAENFTSLRFINPTKSGDSRWEMSPGGDFYLYDRVKTRYRAMFKADGRVGINIEHPTTDFEVNGRTKTKVLEITGADIIEKANANEILAPGTVVVLDVSQPNSVKKSTKSYDSMAFGVVSGADGIPHGIELTAPGMLDGNVNVAIAGRVKVKVTGKVKAGDLLTTSEVAGCAMRVKNRKKSFGSIIGKALSEPDENGLVLMLVNLQ